MGDVCVERTANGLIVRMPPSGFRRLFWPIKLLIVAGLATSFLSFLVRPSELPDMGIIVLTTLCAVLFARLRFIWRIEKGELSVSSSPGFSRRRWPCEAVVEVLRAPGDDGLLVRVKEKGLVDVNCANSREVLERVAGVLNEEISKIRGATPAPETKLR